jgi:hypothetical protein
VPEPELFAAPADLTLEQVERLQTLETEAVAEFDRVMGLEQHTPADLTYTENLAGDLDRIRAELRVRATREAEAATLAQQEQQRQLAATRARVHGPEGGSGTAAAAADVHTDLSVESIAQATAQGVALALFGDDKNKLAQAQQRFASLSATQRVAPTPKVPERTPNAVTASIDIPGIAHGTDLPDLRALGEAFQRKVKAIPTTRDGNGAPRHLVASVRNTFDHTVDERTNPAIVEELWRSMQQGGGSAEALVAAGGWCAPSQLMYDFFNIASAAPQAIDLPTVGISRGGIRFPVSPAIGDVFFQAGGSNPASGFGGFAFSMANTTDPWLWSETDDQLTVTGSVNKPILRVPCPTFSENRLECYGISLTAGNLTDDAYPESTQNFIRLLRAAYAHAINARLIGLMVTASGGANTVTGPVGDAAVPQIINSVGLAATDYRTRYAMGEDDTLEVVFPDWVQEVMRSDLGYKPGINDLGLYNVADATIAALFSSRNVRAQFVSDWQVRGTPGVSAFGTSTVMTTWPTAVNFMLYAAGTFLHGTGLQLDLGVIRDSVMNAENDFTALWAEECHLIAQVGHASRLYTVNFNVGGNVAIGKVDTAKV